MTAPVKSHVLVVDDDRNFRLTLSELLQSSGYTIRSAASGREALQCLEGADINLILCDWRMPGCGGKQLLQQVAENSALRRIPVLIMTAHGSGPTALEAMQLGAYDFITKPLDMQKVLSSVARALHHMQLEREIEELRGQRFLNADTAAAQPSEVDHASIRLIGSSPGWIEVFKNIGKVAKTDVGVLVLGESGTGKEMVARAIHEHSHRSHKPFIIVNCAALPPELIESELFGHERGSFTSAIAQKTGKFEVANGGTVFLDEIGELPLALQPKLLRILQEHTFERVGATSQVRTDVRIIAATNRQLDHDVENKLFRADLYYRLNTYALRLPPLRERVSDILPLAEHFLEQYARRNGMPKQGLSPEAGEVLERHAFPGNVRELEHLMERTAVQAGGRAITAEMIEEQLSTNHVSSTGISLQTLLSLPFHDAVASLEKLLLQEVLRSVGENKSEAARRLGIHRRFLYEKLQQHKLG